MIQGRSSCTCHREDQAVHDTGKIKLYMTQGRSSCVMTRKIKLRHDKRKIEQHHDTGEMVLHHEIRSGYTALYRWYRVKSVNRLDQVASRLT